jgi:hypothetical protein
MKKSILRLFIPSAWPLLLLWASLGLLLAGGALAMAYGLSDRQHFLDNFSTIMGLFVFSSIALLLEIGAWIEKQPPPRFALGLGAALSAGIAGIFTTTSMALAEEPIDPGFSSLCCTLPAVFLLAAPAIIALVRLPAVLGSALQTDQENRVGDYIRRHNGSAALDQMAKELRILESSAGQILTTMLDGKKINGFLNLEYGRFYSFPALVEKRNKLLGSIKAHGKIALNQVAGELQAPAELVKEWIYYLVDKELFSGYINWQDGILYSLEGGQLAGHSCPKCGGELNLAGKGITHCNFCGTEIFLQKPPE